MHLEKTREFLEELNTLYENKWSSPNKVTELFDKTSLQKMAASVFDKLENDMVESTLNRIKEMEKTCMSDNVNHPPHYQSKNGLEVIDIIHDFELNYNLGNVIKYVLRHSKKGGTEDLQKAVWYLNDEIQRRENDDEEDECLPF